ncbi:hypothetical protein F4825DRAFT_419453 [Nemania diffusa]|nr:hypothetical protein F4825DRAFT_419453 [Nemania diffusa]
MPLVLGFLFVSFKVIDLSRRTKSGLAGLPSMPSEYLFLLHVDSRPVIAVVLDFSPFRGVADITFDKSTAFCCAHDYRKNTE